jgi:hypothetical protein
MMDKRGGALVRGRRGEGEGRERKERIWDFCAALERTEHTNRVKNYEHL